MNTYIPTENLDEYGDFVFDEQHAYQKLHTECVGFLTKTLHNLTKDNTVFTTARLPTLEVLHYELAKIHTWVENLANDG